MTQQEPGRPEPDDWDDALAAGRAMFTLACTGADVLGPQTPRERDLVEMALQAGVLGSLSASRWKDGGVNDEQS